MTATRPLEATRAAPPAASVPARGTIQLLVGRAGFMACGYAIAVILARGLGPADYGVYGVIMSVLTVVEMAAALGIPGAAIKLIPDAEHDPAAVARTASCLLVGASLVLFLSLWVLAPTLAGLLDIPDGVWLFRVAFVDLPLTALVSAYQAALYGHRRFDVVSVSVVVYGLAKLGGIVVLLGLGLSVAGALVVNAVSTIGALAALALHVPTAGLRPSAPLVSPLLRLAVPMGLFTALTFTMMNVDLWILKGLGTVGAPAVGGYVAALTIGRVLGAVATVLSPVVFASVCRALAQGDEAMARRHVRGATRFALIVLVPSCALVARNAEALMVAVYSPAYAGTGTLLGLQAAGFGALALLDILLLAALAGGQYRRVVAFLALLILLGGAADVVLVQRLGALGAALGIAGTLALGAAGAVAMATVRFGPIARAATLVRVGGALAVAMAADACLDVEGALIAVKLGALLLLYGGVLLVTRELDARDLGALALWRTSTT